MSAVEVEKLRGGFRADIESLAESLIAIFGLRHSRRSRTSHAQ